MPYDEWWRNTYDTSLTDPGPMPSVQRSQRGKTHKRMAERDAHNLWAACKQFIAQYGVEALDRVVSQAKGED